MHPAPRTPHNDGRRVDAYLHHHGLDRATYALWARSGLDDPAIITAIDPCFAHWAIPTIPASITSQQPRIRELLAQHPAHLIGDLIATIDDIDLIDDLAAANIPGRHYIVAGRAGITDLPTIRMLIDAHVIGDTNDHDTNDHDTNDRAPIRSTHPVTVDNDPIAYQVCGETNPQRWLALARNGVRPSVVSLFHLHHLYNLDTITHLVAAGVTADAYARYLDAGEPDPDRIIAYTAAGINGSDLRAYRAAQLEPDDIVTAHTGGIKGTDAHAYAAAGIDTATTMLRWHTRNVSGRDALIWRDSQITTLDDIDLWTAAGLTADTLLWCQRSDIYDPTIAARLARAQIVPRHARATRDTIGYHQPLNPDRLAAAVPPATATVDSGGHTYTITVTGYQLAISSDSGACAADGAFAALGGTSTLDDITDAWNQILRGLDWPQHLPDAFTPAIGPAQHAYLAAIWAGTAPELTTPGSN